MNITVHVINDKNIVFWHCAINTQKTMDFERKYLPGVVYAEMGTSRELEALKAQAIAARSFAYQYLLKNAAIYDTGKAQAFLASWEESSSAALCRQAVEETAGIIVTYHGAPANTHYSACNAGTVRKSTNAWEPGGYPDPWDMAKVLPDNCHGSGMSQLGARNMAKAGKTYREILQFYYLGTELKPNYGKGEAIEMPEKTRMQAVIDFMREQLNEPYDLGDHGPDSWDCSGLTMEAVELIGLFWPHSSNYQWTENIKVGGDFDAYGTLDTIPANTSVVLFHFGNLTGGGTGMVHVGGRDGATDTVIQAGGYLGKGVHEDPYSKAKNYFSHWATIKGADDPYVPITEPSNATLRINSSGDLVKTLQFLLNTAGANPKLKEDGKFGPLTEAAVLWYQAKMGLTVDGIFGPESWKSILGNPAIEEPELLYTLTYTETLVGRTYDEAMAILAKHPDATMTVQN